MKKLLAIVIVAVFLASLIPMNNTTASTQTSIPIKGMSHPKITKPSTDGEALAFDGSEFLEHATTESFEPQLTPHSPWTVMVSDEYYGTLYPLDFVNVLNGTHCNIWVGLDPDVWVDPTNTTVSYQDEYVPGGDFNTSTWYFAYPWSWTGSSVFNPPSTRLQPGYRDYIFGSQLVELAYEFDNTIWATDTSFFGMYKDRAGPFNDYKVQILIFNIRSGLFYDPYNAAWFVEGYFWDYISNLYNANIIHIDTYQWFRRQGAHPINGDLAHYVKPYLPSQLIPYEYEGTFAHEFQHLIHRDLDPGELSWVNEGCSELAQIVCGYGFPAGHIDYYLSGWFYTSLVDWQGMLENYGAACLFTYYVYQHYGSQFIWKLTHDTLHGIAGYNDALKGMHICKDFDQIFKDWSIANYLNDATVGDGSYGYYNFPMPNGPSSSWSITGWGSIPIYMDMYQYYYPLDFNWIVDTYPNQGMPYPDGLPQLPYTVNYVIFNDGSPALKVRFNGQDYIGQPPPEGKHEWYSDAITTPWAWFRLGHTFSIPAGGATLKFKTYYDTEPDFDYGYVEVHDLTTGKWTTLKGLKTTDTLPYPQDNPNTPNAYEPFAYYFAGKWNAFNGNSGGWIQEQMNLTPFAGHNIELYFTYWTDGGTQLTGWFVDQIQIPEIGFSDNVEHGQGAWSVNAGWYITDGKVLYNKFNVNFIQTVTLNMGHKVTTVDYITHMWLDPKTQDGSALLPAIDTRIATFGPSVMVVASQPGFEHWISTSYSFTADVLKTR
ncbi:MAG: hypothetical protein ABSF24_06955 [Candidatus Bathyarchaeia archaeon]|jgi:hypothetical protein